MEREREKKMNATFETARQIHQIGGGRVIIGSGWLVGAASLTVAAATTATTTATAAPSTSATAAPSVHQRHQPVIWVFFLSIVLYSPLHISAP